MSKVVREDIDKLNAVLSVKIDRQDYEDRFENELKNYKGKAQMKGFRKGKVSTGFLRKAYGPSILADLVNGMLQDEIITYLRAEGSAFLGQPIPSDSQAPYDFDPRNLQDYEFKFDIGIAPEFEVIGVDKQNTFEMPLADVPEETVEEELDQARRNHGQRQESEEPIALGDVLTIACVELEDGAPKADGWSSTFNILVDRIEDEAALEALMGQKKGVTFQFNVFQLEKNASETYAKRYLLNMSEEQADSVQVNETFQGTVEGVLRVVPAEMNQEFYDAYFDPGTVSSEEEARARIRKEIESFYNKQAEALLFRDLQDDLMEKNREQLALPDAFLKRWLVQSNEKNTPELVEKDFENFANSLRWSLIRNKLAQQFEIKITEEEIREGFLERVRGYLGGYMSDPNLLHGMIDRLMQDQQQVESVAEDITSDKVFEKIREQVSVSEKKVTIEDLRAMLEKAKADAEKARAAASLLESEEEE